MRYDKHLEVPTEVDTTRGAYDPYVEAVIVGCCVIGILVLTGLCLVGGAL